MPIEPDVKNWTWVLDSPCLDCGFDARRVDLADMADAVVRLAEPWAGLLSRPDAGLRPTGDQWSALEYACHVRDVLSIYTGRLRLMLTQDRPTFANWDQDATAIEQRYDLADPARVAVEVVRAAAENAAVWATVTSDQWSRTGSRSDGAEFTVATLAKYFLHDPLHHLDDVARGNVILTDSQLD